MSPTDAPALALQALALGLALVLFGLAAAGVVHRRVQFVPLGLVLLVVVLILHLWPP